PRGEVERKDGDRLMQLNTTLSQRLSQQMVLAPRMIQSMEILQLPIMALQERIQQELQENPVLEVRETAEDAAPSADGAEAEAGAGPDTATATEDAPDPGAAELVVEGDGNGELDFDRLE